jgi:uridine kinase
MKKPYVIAISSVSGGGKTALSTLLQKRLPASVLFRFDDFDDTNLHPENYYEWSRRGGDLLEFDCPGMAQAVDQTIQQGELEYIVLDYPFGRGHPRLREVIDLAIFIDTPLDVAMARRILRDYPSESGASPAEELSRLRTELAYYLEKARYPYLDMDRQKPTSDLVLNGWRGLEELKDQILERLRVEQDAMPS